MPSDVTAPTPPPAARPRRRVPDWQSRVLPRSVLGITALILALALGAAFSGAVLYAYYEYRRLDDIRHISIAGVGDNLPVEPTPASAVPAATTTTPTSDAPAPGTEPGHCPAILAQVKNMAPSRLDFLERVDVLENAKVDAATDPATVRLKDAAAYDGIVTLVYSVPGPVVLDISVLDSRTNQRVWREELSTKDPNVAARLERHGFWTPTTLKKFYGRD